MSRHGPTLLFIGCGNMGASIAGGAMRHLPAVRLIALDPDPARARSLLPEGAAVELHATPGGLAGLRPDLVILGVKPQVFGDLDPEVMALMADAPVVSVMAGVPLVRLAAVLGHDRVIRVMPNLPALVGAGMSLGCRTAGAQDAALLKLVETLFAALGRFDWAQDEDQFERANPVFACGPGFVFAFAEQMIAGAVAGGVPPELADRLVRQTLLGSARMLAEDSRDARLLKQAVSSPNGTTQAGLGVLEAEGALPQIIPQTFQAAYRRALELARG